jgi:hypothetical protein
VFLTNNNYSIPFVDSMRAIAVSTWKQKRKRI